MKKRITLAWLPLLSACAGEPPQNIGNLDGRLADCPDSPNCVCSFESRESHYVAPLDASLAQVQQVLLALPEARIVSQQGNYLYAEFTSRLMGFVDDVEFLYDPDAGVTHVRSASRLGYSDLGVNRSRIESIRNRLSN
ncbi:MAG: DUF1499 domain-containing protein [Gammaproteobacteria bacterium]|nr:DUF1499 domain-containing protein [Pseudomonadales bacterium]MCP5348142.1 DUF1499 domain-containing protein [Pseudomonadales bacterium]